MKKRKKINEKKLSDGKQLITIELKNGEVVKARKIQEKEDIVKVFFVEDILPVYYSKRDDILKIHRK